MQVIALKDQWINAVKVRTGSVVAVSKRHAEKLIREGLVKQREPAQKQLETK